jgi:hypothetical protein
MGEKVFPTENGSSEPRTRNAMGLVTIHRLVRRHRRWVSFAGFLARFAAALAFVLGGIWLMLRGVGAAFDDAAQFLRLLLP